MLEINENGSEEFRINTEEFDLNIDHLIQFRENRRIERQVYEAKILSDINTFKIKTKNIIKEHWESLFIKPRSIFVRVITIIYYGYL